MQESQRIASQVYNFRPPTSEEKIQFLRWLAENVFSGDTSEAKDTLSTLRLVVLPDIVSSEADIVSSEGEIAESELGGCHRVKGEFHESMPLRSDVLVVTWPVLPPRVSTFYWDQDRLISTEDKERQIRHAFLSTSEGPRLLLEDLRSVLRRWEATR